MLLSSLKIMVYVSELMLGVASKWGLRLDGKPDLNTIKAFIAKGNMGIVYEANRWHSPMCALDEVCSPFTF